MRNYERLGIDIGQGDVGLVVGDQECVVAHLNEIERAAVERILTERGRKGRDVEYVGVDRPTGINLLF